MKIGKYQNENNIYSLQNENILKLLKNASLKFTCFKSVQNDEIYTLVGCNEERLIEEVFKENYNI